MSAYKKRRTDDGDGLHIHHVTCILHENGIQYIKFIPFSDICDSPIDKLGFLQGIHDKCLSLPHELPYRMEDVTAFLRA